MARGAVLTVGLNSNAAFNARGHACAPSPDPAAEAIADICNLRLRPIRLSYEDVMRRRDA